MIVYFQHLPASTVASALQYLLGNSENFESNVDYWMAVSVAAGTTIAVSSKETNQHKNHYL